MKAQQQPVRWSDVASGASPELHAALRKARQQGPNAAQLERLTSQVLAQLPQLPASSSAPTAPAASPSSAAGGAGPFGALSGMRLPVAIALGAAALSLVVWQLRSAPARHADPRTPAPRAAPIQSAPGAAPTVVDVTPRTTIDPAVRQAPAQHAPAQVVVAAPSPARRPGTRKQLASAQHGAGDPAAEVALLFRVRRALPSAPQQALDLAREHERLFPDGAFAEEREALAIEALIQLGRRAPAAARARALFAAHPESAYRRRIERLLAPVSE